MDLSEIRSLSPEERERILEIQVDFSLLADALNMCAHALHGIIEAETVEEVTPEDLNDAETSLPKATEALTRLRSEFDRSEKFLKSARDAFEARTKELETIVEKLLADIEGNTLPTVWLNENAQRARVLLGKR